MMAKCKLNNCREEAVPGGKPYCAAHLAAYKAKQAEYRRRQAALPDCYAGIPPDCTGKIDQRAVDRGDPMCSKCSGVLEERERVKREEAAALDYTLDRAMAHLTTDCFSDYQLEQLRRAFLELISKF